MNLGLPNQALERTGLSLWVLPWSFGLAHISGPVAQLGRSAGVLKPIVKGSSRLAEKNETERKKPQHVPLSISFSFACCGRHCEWADFGGRFLSDGHWIAEPDHWSQRRGASRVCWEVADCFPSWARRGSVPTLGVTACWTL